MLAQYQVGTTKEACTFTRRVCDVAEARVRSWNISFPPNFILRKKTFTFISTTKPTTCEDDRGVSRLIIVSLPDTIGL